MSGAPAGGSCRAKQSAPGRNSFRAPHHGLSCRHNARWLATGHWPKLATGDTSYTNYISNPSNPSISGRAQAGDGDQTKKKTMTRETKEMRIEQIVTSNFNFD